MNQSDRGNAGNDRVQERARRGKERSKRKCSPTIPPPPKPDLYPQAGS